MWLLTSAGRANTILWFILLMALFLVWIEIILFVSETLVKMYWEIPFSQIDIGPV